MGSSAINIILASVLVFLVRLHIMVFAEETNFDLTMPGVQPTKDDEYLCLAKRLPPARKYIVGYEPLASSRTVHHMLVFVCSEPGQVKGAYKCLSASVCQSQSQIVFAWGLDAASLHLPKDVGLAVGGSSSPQYLVMQLHYTDRSLVAPEGDRSGIALRLSSSKPLFLASIQLFVAMASLPPNREEINVDIACSCAESHPFGCSDPATTVLHPFAFRTHAHDRATQISAYIIRNGKWILIGTQSPQRPQAFYPVPDPSITIEPDDILTARCSYNTTGQEETIGFGSSRRDEMCNFYLMYYVSAKFASEAVFRQCFNTAPKEISRLFPHPPLPFFNGTEGHHHHHHMEHHMEQQPASASKPALASPAQLAAAAPRLTLQRWTSRVGVAPGHLPDAELGQVGGLAVHPTTGHLYVFHRASRVWDAGSFSAGNIFPARKGPIAEATVLVVDPRTGAVVSSWGAGLFYMPHGIFVDGDGNIWLTDVGLHQVFKFTPDDLTKPALVLGKRFIPFKDDDHFCKPADVVVDSQGFIYVADGYCNHRIMKFSPTGQLVLQWAMVGTYDQPSMHVPFNIPHALTMNAAGTRLCVADRGNGRVLCYKPSTGRLMTVNTPREFGRRVFTIAFSDHPSGYLYAVKPRTDDGSPAQGFTLLPGTKTVLNRWYPEPSKSFTRPHTMAVGKDGTVYVGEIGPNLLWKFRDTAAMAGPASTVTPAGHVSTGAPTTQQPKTSLPVAAETTAAATTIAPTTTAPTTAAPTTMAPTTTMPTTASPTTMAPTTAAPTTTSPTTIAPTTMAPTTTAPTTAAPTTAAPTTAAPTTTAPTTTAPTTTAPTTTAPMTVGQTTRTPTTTAVPTTSARTTSAATTSHVPPAPAATASITTTASPTSSESGRTPPPATFIWEIPVTSTGSLSASAASAGNHAKAPDANTRSPSRPIATGAWPAPSSHAADDHDHTDDADGEHAAGHLVGTTSAAATNGSGAPGGASASSNVAVVFVLAFLCCILLLVVLLAGVRYCFRQQRQRGHWGGDGGDGGGTPLRKLVSLTKRNGGGRGVEFQKLQQECSDSDGF